MPEIDKDCERIVREVTAQLRALREEKGLSKSELSQLSGVSRTTIRRIEEGERSPSIYVLLLISRAMEVELGDLINQAS